MWTFTASHLVDCFGMLWYNLPCHSGVSNQYTQKGNCLFGKHTLKKAFCAATRGLLLPMSFNFLS